LAAVAFIEVRGLTKKYGSAVYALNHTSFTVEKGEWIAVMGPSGSGKSTLLNILGCLDTGTDGQVIIEGQDLATLGTVERARFRAEKIGFIFQQFHLVPYLTAVENVMLAQYLHSLADENEAADTLRCVGLGDRLHHLPSELSGGEQQRVCIARALINQPQLILADEPTGNLDEVNEAIVMSLLTRFNREGRTVIIVTHDPAIARMAERRIELHHGRLTEVSLLAHREEELFDHLLRAVWKSQGSDKSVGVETLPEFAESRATFHLLAAGGWIELGEHHIALTPKGERRALDVIRRHRLAERLFYEVFGLEEALLHDAAHKIEGILRPDVTDKICTFLHHPQTCPHGDPIPRGECCAKAAINT
jgi:putative ABC transport system ATP-binding protein